MDAMLAGIEQWNHRHPDRWDTVTTPGEYHDGSDDGAACSRWDGAPVSPWPRPRRAGSTPTCSGQPHAERGRAQPPVFFLEDNGYDLMVFSWHRNQQGLFDAMSFKHLQ